MNNNFFKKFKFSKKLTELAPHDENTQQVYSLHSLHETFSLQTAVPIQETAHL